MKFGQTLEQGVKKARPPKWEPAFVLYKELKKQLKGISTNHAEEVACRRAACCDDECSLCLEPFETDAKYFATGCGHKFHPVCFVDAVTVGPSRCPLCRRSLEEILPSSLDGVILGLAAKLRIQSDAIQECHNKWLVEVEKEISKVDDALHADWIGGLMTLFQTKLRKKNLVKRIGALFEQIQFIVDYIRINVMAFRKITKKIDKQLGTSFSQPFINRVAKRRFFLDCCEGGNGRLAKLHSKVVEMAAACMPSGKSSFLRRLTSSASPRSSSTSPRKGASFSGAQSFQPISMDVLASSNNKSQEEDGTIARLVSRRASLLADSSFSSRENISSNICTDAPLPAGGSNITHVDVSETESFELEDVLAGMDHMLLHPGMSHPGHSLEHAWQASAGQTMMANGASWSQDQPHSGSYQGCSEAAHYVSTSDMRAGGYSAYIDATPALPQPYRAPSVSL